MGGGGTTPGGGGGGTVPYDPHVPAQYLPNTRHIVYRSVVSPVSQYRLLGDYDMVNETIRVYSKDFRGYLDYFGWNQTDLARRLDITPDTVSRWKGKPPTVVLMYLEERYSRLTYRGRFLKELDAQLGNIVETVNYAELALGEL